MIGISKEKVKNIPYLTVVDHIYESEALPTVFYSHGFASAKEHNLPIAYLLAEKGIRVILPDSEHHGEREYQITSTDREMAFWDTIIKTINELEVIKDHLTNQGLILEGKVGLAGTSMGGITTAGALTKYPWINVAAILMGTPKITEYAEAVVEKVIETEDLDIPEQEINSMLNQLQSYDLSLQPEKLAERPLMFWHGDKDHVVPFELSYDFYKSAKKQYTNQDNIKFLKEVNKNHKVSRYAILETVHWFETHLLSTSD